MPNDWIREELILALDQYVEIDFPRNPSRKNSRFLQLADVLNRLPSRNEKPPRNKDGVYDKLRDMLRFELDPRVRKKRSGAGSGGDELVWKAYAYDAPERRKAVAEVLLSLGGTSKDQNVRSLWPWYGGSQENQALETLTKSTADTLEVDSLYIQLDNPEPQPQYDDGEGLEAVMEKMALQIAQRCASSGNQSARTNPNRKAGSISDLRRLVRAKWDKQNGLCGLCDAPIPMPAITGPLQPSPDRINSTSPNYDDENLHITHLGCNLAKNKYSVPEYYGWLNTIRAAGKPKSHA